MAGLTEAQQAFIDRYAPYANLASQQTGLPSRVILGKLAIESDWGQRMYRNDIAGLKPGAAAQNEGSLGSGATGTFEDYSGGRTQIKDNFLQYASPEQGIGGFVTWLTNSGIPSINGLADRLGGGNYSPDNAADTAAINALNSSPFSTDVNLPRTLPERVGLIPDLTRYGVASSFDPTLNRLAQIAPYQAAGADVSLGAGDITSNNYWSRGGWNDSKNNSAYTTQYQGQGQVLPREKNASGLALPGPDMAGSPAQLSALDKISDGLTGSLRAGANLIGNRFVEATGRLPSAEEFGARVDALKSGASNLITQLTEIASSPEAKTFAQSTGLDPNQYVVNDIYRLGLGRGVDAGSLPQQMDVLRAQGAQGLLNSVTNSQEGRTYALNNYYGSAFGHEADTPGMNYWLGQLAAGKTMPAVQAEILASPEAQALAPSVREQLASLITPSFMTPTLGFTGSQVSPVGPGGISGTIGAGPTQYPLGPGSTTYPVGPDGYEVSPVGPGSTTYPNGAGSTTYPVGPDGYEVGVVTPTETKPVGPDGYEVGTVPPPALSPEVRNYYETYLHRAPDAQGAIEYQGQIDRGVSPSIVEAQILSAPEAVQALTPEEMASRTSAYQAKYGLLPEEAKTLAPLASDFAKVLGRPADSKTIQWWDQQIDAGAPMSLLEAQLIQAPETQALPPPALSKVVQDYQTQYGLKPDEVTALGPLASEFGRVLDRPADIPTMQAWDAQLDAGATMPQLTAQFLTAPEVQARTGGRGDAFDSFQAQYGRSASDYLAGLNNGFGFTGANVSGGVGNGSWHGTFNGADYLAANPDVAAAKMNPWEHYARFGYGEGRAVDTAGDRLPQGFDGTAYLAANPDVARAGMNPFEHFARYGAGEGRQMPTLGSYGFSGADVSQGLGPVGPGTWNGKFNAADYLAANQDVARSGMNAEDHYLRFGFGEGRSLDLAGHKINQGFDPTAYLNANQDVKAAGMDPLRHYIDSGAAEGRAVPTGGNSYQFSNYNFAQGAGPTGNGGFGIGGITSSAPGGMGSAPSSSSPLPAFGSNLNVSGGVGNGSFGLGGVGIANEPPPSTATVESAAPNALQGSGGIGGSAFAYKDKNGNDLVATFDPQKSENAYLAGQVAQNQSQIEAGRASVANNPNLWNFGATNLLNSVAASNYQPGPIYSTATGATAALPSPVGPTFNSPLPVLNQGLGVNPYGGFGLISTF